MSETFANEISSEYFTLQAFCGNLGSIVITYESDYRRLSTLDIEASMKPDGFHLKLLISCQTVEYPIYLLQCGKKSTFSLQCGQLLAQWKESLVIPPSKKGSHYSPYS